MSWPLIDILSGEMDEQERGAEVMIDPKAILFGVNEYDRDGDLISTCIDLHVGGGTILRFGAVSDLEEFANGIITRILPEIRDNYPETQEE